MAKSQSIGSHQPSDTQVVAFYRTDSGENPKRHFIFWFSISTNFRFTVHLNRNEKFLFRTPKTVKISYYIFWFILFWPCGWKSLTTMPSWRVFSMNISSCCSNASNRSILSAILKPNRKRYYAYRLFQINIHHKKTHNIVGKPRHAALCILLLLPWDYSKDRVVPYLVSYAINSAV